MSRFTARYVFALIVALSCASFSFAQVNTGSIGGTVSDPGGAAVPAATVVATSDQTRSTFETLSSETGLYLFPSLPTGTYTVTAEKEGFKKASRGGLEVRVASRVDLNLGLEIGDVQQAVEVTAVAPLLETSTSEHGPQFHRLKLNPLRPVNLAGLPSALRRCNNSGPRRTAPIR